MDETMRIKTTQGDYNQLLICLGEAWGNAKQYSDYDDRYSDQHKDAMSYALALSLGQEYFQ